MGGLLLCSSRRAAAPYAVEDRIEIQSLEELCFYLYQNGCSITEDFFSEKLMQYLTEELGQKKLADTLWALKKEEADVMRLILAVCEAANYYTEEELTKLKQKLSEFMRLGKTERMKLLADSWMQQKRYVRALRGYEAILGRKHGEELSQTLEGRIYHNMGTAYARMMRYHEAERCLLKAEELLSAPETRRELLLLYYLTENTGQYEKLAQELPQEEQKELLRRWEEKRKSSAVAPGRREALLEKWKQEYRWEMT